MSETTELTKKGLLAAVREVDPMAAIFLTNLIEKLPLHKVQQRDITGWKLSTVMTWCETIQKQEYWSKICWEIGKFGW